MTVFVLELTAMVTMLLDHIQVVFSIDPFLRCIGRIAFPLYAFLIVNGYYHVRKKEGGLRRYLLRLLLLAVVSEFTYDLMSEGVPVDWDAQNQVLQFFIAMAALTVTGWIRDHTPKDGRNSPDGNASSGRSIDSFVIPSCLSVALRAVVWAAAIAVCYCFHIGYSGSGILLIMIYKLYFDKFYDKDYPTRLAYLVIMTLVFVAVEWVEVHHRAGISMQSFIENIDWYFRWYKRNTWASFGMPLAAAYQGERGYNGKDFRIFYRIFYPAHQFILWTLKLIL